MTSLDFRDVLNDPGAPRSQRLAAQRLGMSFSALTAPLMWQGRGIGTLGITAERRGLPTATHKASVRPNMRC